MKEKKTYLIAMISKISIIFISMITSALINRTLGVEIKGQFAYINNWSTIIISILSFGIGQTYSTYRRKYGKEALNTFVFLTLFQSAISFVIFLVTVAFNMSYTVKMSILIATMGILRNNILYIAAIEDIKRRDFNNIIYKLIYLILVLIAYILSIKSLNVMIVLLILDEIIIVVGTFWRYKFRPDLKFLKRNDVNLFQIYKLGFISMLMYLMITLNYNLDVIFLKIMSTDVEVGLYSVAVQFANLLWLIPDAFKDVIMSKTAKEDSVDEIVVVTKLSLYISIVIIFGFLIFGKLVIKILYGDEFLDSYGPTVLLLIGSLSMIIYKIIHPLYVSKGKQSVVLKVLFVAVIINIVANMILIPVWGMNGAAIASVFSYTFCSLIFVIIFCKEYNIRYSKLFIISKSEIVSLKEKLNILYLQIKEKNS